jgi:hypothetical protein
MAQAARGPIGAPSGASATLPPGSVPPNDLSTHNCNPALDRARTFLI